MKNLKAPFLVIALLFLNVLLATPKHQLPKPEAGVMTDDGSQPIDDDDCPGGCATPPDYPIDENIVFLLTAGLILGATVVYKNKIKKASI